MLLFAVATVAAATVASAAQPLQMLPVSNNIERAATVRAEQQQIAQQAESAASFGTLRSFNTGTHEMGGLYQMPSGTFYGGTFPFQGKEYYSMLTLVPAGTPLTFKSMVFAGANDDKTPAFDDWDNVARKWDYFSGYTFHDLKPCSSTQDSISVIAPCDVDVALVGSPMLSIDYYSMADTFQLYNMMPGGKLFYVTPEGVSDVETLLYPFTNFISLGFCPSTYYGTQLLDEASGLTMNGYSNEQNMKQWGDAFKQEFGEDLVSTSIGGYYSTIGYAGTPYALSSLTMGFNYLSTKGGVLTFNFVRMDGNKITDDIIYTYDYKVPAASTEQISSATIPFVSTDEWEEELSYMMIDCPVFVEIYGLEDFEMFVPHCVGYNYDNVNSRSVADYSGTLLSLQGQTQKMDGILSQTGYWVWESTRDKTAYVYKSFDIKLDVEYPNLVASRYQINGKETHFGYRANDSYAVDLAEGENQVVIFLATSAAYADELYIDDSELPSWLTLESVDDYYAEDLNGGAIQRAAVLTFTTDGTYGTREGHVTVEYKGKKITVYVGQGGAGNDAGINDVNAAENGAVEYFDVQGRKLQAAPANGFFLQRQGNKVTKVIR